jgi:hypothetical protein
MWHHPGMLRKCLLSSRSRVRVAVGARIQDARSVLILPRIEHIVMMPSGVAVPDGFAFDRPSCTTACLVSSSAMACCRSSLPCRHTIAAREVKAAPLRGTAGPASAAGSALEARPPHAGPLPVGRADQDDSDGTQAGIMLTVRIASPRLPRSRRPRDGPLLLSRQPRPDDR